MNEIESATVEVRLTNGKAWRFELETTPDRPMTGEVNTDREVHEVLTEDGLSPGSWRQYEGGRTFAAVKLSGCIKSGTWCTVAAHRAILERHQPMTAGSCDWCWGNAYREEESAWPCVDVRSIAAIYTDREGWDPSWRADA